MAFVRGERFHLDLDDGPDLNRHGHGDVSPPQPSGFDFVKDITERAASAPTPPSAPTPKTTSTGFPAHKKRSHVSAFKRERHGLPHARPEPALPSSTTSILSDPGDQESAQAREKRNIDEENRKKLAAMSHGEIEQERQELFAGLNPSLIEKLLRRATINDNSNEAAFDAHLASSQATHGETSDGVEKGKVEEKQAASVSKPTKKVAFDVAEPTPSVDVTTIAESGQKHQGLSDDIDDAPTASVHFPRPPQPPELDPSSPDFLESLHDKYFPSLAHDPKALDWMRPVDESQSSYNPSQASLSPASLRFSFNGALIPPKTARDIPVSAGLHHHGDAPEAAGYTIPELAILARSQVPGQRCIAFQTLGRLLYRLGVGEFGQSTASKQSVSTPDGPVKERVVGDSDDEDENMSVLANALWDCVEREAVIEIITDEASKETGHLSARTYAQEALWNWRRGGGRKRKAV